MFWPCETRTSTCRSFATISSGLYRFLAIAVLLDVKDIPQVGPLQRGRINDIYSGLMDHFGESSCCNETDCRPAHYRVTAAGVDMLLDDEWVRVPNNVIQYRRL